MKKKIKELIERRKVSAPEHIERAAEQAPRITNQTVAEHREQVLSSARKYILPLAHSRKQIITITTVLFVVGVVSFFTYITLALYKFHSDSTFIYRVTQVIPFPIAKAGNRFVAYENYLFELRRYKHYYVNQEGLDFSDPQYQGQLEAHKRQTLEAVVNDAYVKSIADEKGITVSNQEIEDEIALLRSQNRTGGSEKVFEGVLKEYWGWSVDEFKRRLHTELLAQKVVSELDTGAHERAQNVLAELRAGKDFSEAARQFSDDQSTKENGGEFGYPIDRTTRSVSARTTEELFTLQPGEISGIINTGASLEIVKSIEVNADKVRAAHIVIHFKDIVDYINEKKDADKAQTYVSFE